MYAFRRSTISLGLFDHRAFGFSHVKHHLQQIIFPLDIELQLIGAISIESSNSRLSPITILLSRIGDISVCLQLVSAVIRIFIAVFLEH